MTNITTGRPDNRASAGFYILNGLLFAISLTATIYFSHSMSGGMVMPGGWTMSMMWMRMPEQTWFESAMMFLLMWLVMMVAMMLPSALPMLLNFRRSLSAENYTRAGLSTMLVACGYFTVWMGIGAALYAIGIIFAIAAMQSPGLSFAVPILNGATLILAGVFQFSHWKMIGLRQCRDPLVCSTIGPAGWSYGFRQGIFCGICCSGLMLVLVALGMMNPLVMLAVASVIASEKLLSKPQPVVHFAGLLAVVTGCAMVIRSLF